MRADFFNCMDQATSALRKFGPDVLVLSLGFDIYANDPQSKVSVSHEGFRLLGQRIKALGIPCVVVREGAMTSPRWMKMPRDSSPA